MIAGSRSDGVRAAFGSACGLLVHATFAAIGLSALVMSSTRALTLVKLLGGIYLIWLGVTTWRSARRGVEPTARRRWRLPSSTPTPG
ncbi:LysE family transporter [Streptomyces albulus]|nr:LysE family transporter [Streptomyces noursei]